MCLGCFFTVYKPEKEENHEASHHVILLVPLLFYSVSLHFMVIDASGRELAGFEPRQCY